VAIHCAAFRLGLQDKIPRAGARAKPLAVREAAVVVRRRGCVLLRQCAPGERWAGLWDFPRFRLDGEGPAVVRRELAAGVREQTGVTVAPGELLRTLKHGVTRYRITLDCYEARYASGRAASTPDRPVRWTPLAALDGLPLSVTGRRIAQLVAEERSRRARAPRA
jgi:A/G-specific adenine glycosylase